MKYPLYSVPDIVNFRQFFAYLEEHYSDETAFLSRKGKITYRKFLEDIQKGMEFYRKNQIKTQIVGLGIQHSYCFAVAFFAIVLSGNIVYLLGESEKPEEFEGLNVKLTRAETEEEVWKYCDGERIYPFDWKYYEEIYKEEIYEEDTYKEDTYGERFYEKDPYEEGFCREKFYEEEFEEEFYEYIRKAGVSVICMSSGTTSYKKEVMLSQENLCSDTVSGLRLFQGKKGTRFLNILPYTHLFGLVADLFAPLLSGCVICIPENRLHFLKEMRFFQPEQMNLPPSLIHLIWRALEQTGDKSYACGGKLKKILCAGAKFDEKENELFQQYGFRVYTAYGLSECSPCVSMNRENDYKEGSCGLLLDCNQVRIDEHGRIFVKGKNVMLGYFRNEEATRAVLKDGWLDTGDYGRMDEDGFLFLEGRSDTVIATKDGKKLFLEDFESIFCELPFVEEAQIVVDRYHDGAHNLHLILVCCQAAEEAAILQAIQKVNGQLEYYKIDSYEVTEERRKRNQLGKIIRNQEEAGKN